MAWFSYTKTYMRSKPDWAIWDFTKVGLPDYEGGIFTAEIVEQYKKNDKQICLYKFREAVEKEHGLPYFWVEIDKDGVVLKWFGKKASRLPQAFWLKFRGFSEDWEINKMGVWIKPENIAGSPLINAVQKGIRNDTDVIEPLDSCLVAPFGRNLLKYNIETNRQDMYFNLYNNIWNTNFPMWYSDDAIFRFRTEKRVDKKKK